MPANTEAIRKENMFLRMHLRHRIITSLVVALIAYLLLFKSSLDGLVLSMIVWNAFALSFIITSWIVFFTRNSRQMRIRARQEDGSRLFVFLIVLLSSFASLFAVLFLILSKDAAGTPKNIYVPVAVSNMLLSWVLVHTTFCFHYAHLYYDDSKDSTEIHAGGLSFPQEKKPDYKPDYIDFVYFSFVIGMTFQVSDVEITSRTIRRLALLHGLISFGLNTFVVALTINLIAGLRH
jgi:uncharacterized membrane protein